MALTKMTKGRARWTTFKLKVAQAVSRTLYDKLIENGISVKDFGAVGDGVADDTQSFINAANYCRTTNKKLVGDGRFKITGEGLIDLRSIKLDIDGVLDFGTDVGFIILGGTSTTTINPRQYIREVAATNRTELNPAVQVYGTKNQTITVDRCPSIKLFADNSDGGSNTSIAYCSFYFNYVNTLYLYGAPKGAASFGGWINENTFYLKRCTRLIIGDQDVGTYQHNNNIFHGGTFEGSSKIIFRGATDNTMYDLRLESADDNAISFGNRTLNNKCIISWVASAADQPVYDYKYIDEGRGNLVYSNDDAAYNVQPLFILNKDTVHFDVNITPTKCNIYGVGFWTTESENPAIGLVPNLSKEGNKLKALAWGVIARTPKIPVSMSADTWFMFNSAGSTPASGGWRITVYGYDKDGNVMAGAAGDVVVLGSPAVPFGTSMHSINASNGRFCIGRKDCRYVVVSVRNGDGVQLFDYINLAIRNPKVSVISDVTRFASDFVVPCNTPALN